MSWAKKLTATVFLTLPDTLPPLLVLRGRFSPYQRIAGLHPLFWIWAGLTVVSAAALFASIYCGVSSYHDFKHARAELDSLRRNIPGAAHTTHVKNSTDFVTRLPQVLQPEAILADASIFSTKNNLKIMDFSVQHDLPASNHLGQMHFVFNLRGSYASTKGLVRVLLEDYPGLVVDRMSMHKSAGPVSSQIGYVVAPVVPVQGQASASVGAGVVQDSTLVLTQWLKPQAGLDASVPPSAS